ncbi:MAG TPA: hypothetical protein VI756_31835 [Blastocatellia bacterium]
MMMLPGPPKFVVDQEKVLALTDRVIMGSGGTARITTQAEPLQDLVNGLTLSKKYFQRHRFKNTTKFWRGLSEQIAERFDYWLSRGRAGPVSGEFFYFYLSEAGVIDVFMIKMDYHPITSVRIQGGYPTKKHLMCWGYQNVLNDLHKHKPNMGALRKDPLVKTFLNPDINAEDRTIPRAIEFADMVMDKSSLVLPSKGNVSREFSYCTLEGKVALD